MGNWSNLVVTSRDTICLNFADPDSSDSETIAAGKYCVPFLWFGLFRPADMRSEVFNGDGDDITLSAPIAPVESALRQLQTAIPRLNEMFEALGRIDGYAELLSGALSSAGRRFVTIDLEEIAGMGDEDDFYNDVKELLAAIEGTSPIELGRDKLFELSGVPKNAKFPHHQIVSKIKREADQELVARASIVGVSRTQTFPWE